MGRVEKNSDFISKFLKTEPGTSILVEEEFRKQKLDSDPAIIFEDKLFPPNDTCIINVIEINSPFSKEELEILSSYKMLPFSEIYRNYHNLDEVFSFEINSKVSFGPVANVNLFNCILFLTIFKPRIKNMFFVIGQQRAFRVKLLIRGKIKTILVDENLPAEKFEKKSPCPSFIRTSSKSSWMNFIEKALAKVKKSYANILRMKCSELFPYLSEAPLVEYEHKKISDEKKKIWNIFFKAAKKNWIIFTELKENPEKSFSTISSIKEAIFILSAFQHQDERFVKIYFPSTIYDSIISLFKIDTSHDVYKEEGYIKESEFNSRQILLLKFDEYYQIMEKTFALKYEDTYSYFYKKYKVNNQNYQATKFKIYRHTKATISMHVKDPNLLSRMVIVKVVKTPSEYGTNNTENSIEVVSMSQKMTKLTSVQMSQATSQLSSSRKKGKKKFSFNNKDEVSFHYIDSSFGKTDRHCIELALEEGIYIILFKIALEDLSQSTVLSIYSECSIKFEENFDADELKLFDCNIQNLSQLTIFQSYLSLKGQADVIENVGDFHVTSSLTDSTFGYSCIEFSNYSKTKILCCNLGYDYQGMRLISHETKKKTNNQLSFLSHQGNDILKVYPGNREMVIFEWEKTNSEINLNFYPKFYSENLYLDNERLNKIENFHKKIVCEDVFYYEIFYKNKIYLVFCNQSTRVDYKLQVEISSLNNLVLANVKNIANRVNITLMRSSKEILMMKVISLHEQPSYKMQISPQKLN